MYIIQFLNGLKFKQNKSFDNNIDAISAIEFHTLITKWQLYLVSTFQTT